MPIREGFPPKKYNYDKLLKLENNQLLDAALESIINRFFQIENCR